MELNRAREGTDASVTAFHQPLSRTLHLPEDSYALLRPRPRLRPTVILALGLP